MSIQDLITLSEKKLANLSSLYTQAENIGDFDQMNQLLTEINSVNETITKLKGI